MSRSLLKRCWRAAPQSLRLLFCAGLCRMRAQKRSREVGATDPLFVCGAFGSASGLGQGTQLVYLAMEFAAEQSRKLWSLIFSNIHYYSESFHAVHQRLRTSILDYIKTWHTPLRIKVIPIMHVCAPNFHGYLNSFYWNFK